MRLKGASCANSSWIPYAQYGSDIIVDLLKTLGIEYTAFNPETTFRGLHDSIVTYGGNRLPEIIKCGHEEVTVAPGFGIYAKGPVEDARALLPALERGVTAPPNRCLTTEMNVSIFHRWP